MRKALPVTLVAALVVGALLAPAASAQRRDLRDALAAFDSSRNMHLQGISERSVPLTGDGSDSLNSDLAFWDNLAVQGTFEGFRIVDIRSPAQPREVVDFDDCGPGTSAAEGDVVVWEDILVRSWSSPAPDGGGFCGDVPVPAGDAGVHVFDIGNPADPVALTFVETPCGSRAATAVPDPEHDRLLVYSSPSSDAAACHGIDIIEVPLDDPASASYLRFESSGQPAGLPNLLTIDGPSSAAGTYQVTRSNFGPQPGVPEGDLHDHDEDPDVLIVTGDLAVVNAGGANPTQGCGPLIDFPEGAIAVADRGGCSFVQIVGNAQAAGASAVIVVNNTGAAPINLGGSDSSITIPSGMVSQADGEAIKAGLPAAGTFSGNPMPPIPVEERPCRDTSVILGDVMRAACAGGDGVTVWSLDPEDRGSLENPQILYSRAFPGITDGTSVAFTYDGEVLVFAHEPGGGTEARCQEDGDEIDRTLFFIDTETGAPLGTFELPRPQDATENCAWHNFNVVPTEQGYVLVAGNHQAGISVVDFTDPANAREVAYADPDPLVHPSDPDAIVRGGDWAAYWYDGRIYQSDTRRGLLVWNLSDSAVAGAKKLRQLNPQTQETSFALKRPVTRPTGSLELVGHEPLLDRGMNAALAIHGDYAYIGSRTDLYGGNEDVAGIMVVDISDPANPEVVNTVGQPDTANPGESSRELRVWQSQEILIVLHTNCSGGLHNCTPPSRNSLKFYDISGENADDPQLIVQHNRNTHEFFLWEDPFDPENALLIAGSAGTSSGGTNTAFTVWDISPVIDGEQPTVLFAGGHGYSGAPGVPNGGLHSLSVSNDGKYAYYAMLTGGFAVVDVSDFTAGVENPQRRLVTPNVNRPTWPGPGAHSAVKLYNRDWVYASDEVYGTAAASGHGCPWGWARMIDISDPTQPSIEGEYRVDENWPWLCHQNEPRPHTSYSAHNPTQTPNTVMTTWHSNGFQMINVEDPKNPYQLAEYMPEPLHSVVMEDPMLSSDPDTGQGEKVVMWSYPIVKDGLIYVVDVRNGLYILEYEGPFEDEVSQATFLEGNSNLGHALCFEPVLEPKENPSDPDRYFIPEYC